MGSSYYDIYYFRNQRVATGVTMAISFLLFVVDYLAIAPVLKDPTGAFTIPMAANVLLLMILGLVGLFSLGGTLQYTERIRRMKEEPVCIDIEKRWNRSQNQN